MEIAYSVNRVPIRLTEERWKRWKHIVSAEPTISHLFKTTTHFLKLPATKMWLDYDSGADVLYIHFEEKPASTHSEMGNNGIILDYRDKQLVGLTILEASMRNQSAGNHLQTEVLLSGRQK